MCLNHHKVLHIPNLNSRVHVIVDIIVLQDTVAVVVKVDPNLLQ